MKKSTVGKPSLIKALAFIFIISTGFTLPLYQARAQVVTSDPWTEIAAFFTSLSTNTTAGTSIWEKTIKPSLDGIAVAAAQRITMKLATKALNSLTGGASGDQPSSIIQDFNQYFNNLQNEQVSIYAQSYMNSDNPYAQQFAKGLMGSLSNPGGVRMPKIGSFSLGKIVSPAKFAQNFSSGGYDAWTSMFIDPNNRPTGFFLNASSDLANSIQNEKDNRTVQLTSSGIEPKQVCGVPLTIPKKTAATQNAEQQNESNNGAPSPEQQGAQGQQQGSGSNDTVFDPAAIGGENFDPSYIGTDNLGTFGTPSTPNQTTLTDAQLTTQQQTNSGLSQEQLAAQQQETNGTNGPTWNAGQAAIDSLNTLCDTQITKVPAAFAVQYGAKALTAAFDKLANVSSMEQMIGNALVDLTEYGIKEIRGHNDFVASSPNVSGANRPAGKSGLNVVDFTSGLEQQLEKTSTELEILQKANNEYSKYPSQYAAMDRCLPGPDRGFESRLNDFVTKKAIGRVDIIATRDSNRGERAAYAKEDLGTSVAQAILQEKNDLRDTKMNLPGAGAMLLEKDTFGSVSIDYSELQQRIKDKSAAVLAIRQAISSAHAVGAGAFSDVPNPVYTYADWKVLTQAQKDAMYQLATATNGGNLTTLTTSPNNLFQIGAVPSTVTLPGDLQPVTTVAQYQALPINARRALYLTANAVSPTDAQLAAQNPNDANVSPYVANLLATQSADPTAAALLVTEFSKDYKRFVTVLRFTWNRWEAYGTATDENGQIVVTSDDIENQKNIVRRAFLQYQSSLSSEESIADAESMLSKIQNKIQRTKDLTHDCRLLKYEIMTQYWDIWDNTGSRLRQKLVDRIQAGTIAFRTQDFKQDIISGQSNILSFDCPTDGYFGWVNPLPNGYSPNSSCIHSNEHNDFFNIAIGNVNGAYQMRPTHQVQEVIVRDYFKSLYCRFDREMMFWNTDINNLSGNLQPGYRLICPGSGSSWLGQWFGQGNDLPQTGVQSDQMRQYGPLHVMSNTGQTFLSFFGTVDPSGTDDYGSTGYDYLGTGNAGLGVGQGSGLRDAFGDSIEPHLNWYVLSNAEASAEFFQTY